MLATRWLVLLVCAPVGSTAVELEVELNQDLSPQLRPEQTPEVALALALSGGGMRAANFAVGVMLAMEQQPTLAGNLLLETDYFSTASGGGIAAAAFLGARWDHLHRPTQPHPIFRFADRVAPETPLGEALRTGYGRMLTAPGCKTVTVARDRGHGFEQLLNDRLLAAASPYAVESNRTLVLGDLFRPAALPVAPELVLPQWVANATSAESGARIPLTPSVLSRAFVTGYVHRCTDRALHDPYALPWSVALKASASLPGVIPETVLATGHAESTNRLHLTDGGVADNQGIITALELLRQVALNEPNVRRKILIVVDAYRGDEEGDFSASPTGRVAAVAAGRAIYLLKAAQRLGYKTLGERLAAAHGIELHYLSFTSITDPALRRAASRTATDLSLSRNEQELLWRAGAAAFSTISPKLSEAFLSR